MRILTAVLTLLVLATPASASPVIVARDGEIALQAQRKHGNLCIEIVDGDATCAPAPSAPDDALTVLDGRGPYGAAVDPAVARVEVETRSGSRQSVPTVGAPGFRSRFALIARPGHVTLARFYDADGKLIGAVEQELPTLAPSVLRTFGDGTIVRIEPRASIDGTRAQPDRIVTSTCLRVRNANRACTDDPVRSVAACRGGRQVIFGVLPAAAQHVHLDLTDGRTVDTRSSALDGGQGYAVQIGARTGVRHLRATDGRGNTVAGGPLGFPPCSARDSWDGRDVAVRPVTAATTVATAGDHALVAAPAGDLLCVGVDRIQQPCLPVPFGDGDFVVLRRSGVAIGVVDPDIVTVRIRRGTTATDVPTVADPRFPEVRFFITPAGSSPIRAAALTGDGRKVGDGLDLQPTLLRRGVVAAHRGRRLIGIRFSYLGEVSHCVASPGRLGAGSLCASGLRWASVEVGCAPHRQAMVFGHGRHVVVRLADGRRVRVRHRAGVFFAFPPPGVGVRSVRIGDQLKRVHLPPATRQCGYGAELNVR